MKIIKYGVLFVVVMLSCSCSWFSRKPKGPPAPQTTSPPAAEPKRTSEPTYPFLPNDITFEIKADPQLNRYRNNAHTLLLCIFQLKDPNGFNQLAEEEGGLPKLMECQRFDATVANARRLVIQPGQVLTDVRDRAQGARYIGLVSGYYGTGKEKVSQLVPLPSPETVPDYAGTTITIQLGPNELESVTVK